MSGNKRGTAGSVPTTSRYTTGGWSAAAIPKTFQNDHDD